jgi:hypothetical protein
LTNYTCLVKATVRITVPADDKKAAGRKAKLIIRNLENNALDVDDSSIAVYLESPKGWEKA